VSEARSAPNVLAGVLVVLALEDLRPNKETWLPTEQQNTLRSVHHKNRAEKLKMKHGFYL